ncbi:hypothetical protein TIFTF001_006705 [Ficus carica]|uniref:Fe2OG dioxygenase domain-containing protein n=1 Tax=Ficus carica TaxID=3494 RepID=A0AA87ZNE9_FICCA|nr:hypothetical protein TIFTF001_006705 [Ficus carica]
MGSQTDEKIPVIEFTEKNLKPGSDLWDLACKQIRHGLEEYGCFEAVYDKVPTELHNSIFSAAKELFDLPIETKEQKTSDRPGANYVGQDPFVPLYESLGLDNPTSFEATESFTRIMWPAGNDTFRESVRSFSKPVAELYETATRMVFDSYGVGRLYDSHIESAFYRVRFFKYSAPKPNESNVGMPTHIDMTFVTILHQHQVEGLQIRTKDDKYIAVQAKPSSFLFIAGEGLMAWSNDRIRVCEHRVILKENKGRLSLGFYALVNGVIKVPEELVDEEYPLSYKPIDYMDFLVNFFTNDTVVELCSGARVLLKVVLLPLKTFPLLLRLSLLLLFCEKAWEFHWHNL